MKFNAKAYYKDMGIIFDELLACHEIGFDANPERMEIEMEYIYI